MNGNEAPRGSSAPSRIATIAGTVLLAMQLGGCTDSGSYPKDTTDTADTAITFEVTPCNDGDDNDGDGLIDSDDPMCVNGLYSTEAEQCNDGVDNEGDGWADDVNAATRESLPISADPDCEGPTDNDESLSGFQPAGETDNDDTAADTGASAKDTGKTADTGSNQ